MKRFLYLSFISLILTDKNLSSILSRKALILDEGVRSNACFLAEINRVSLVIYSFALQSLFQRNLLPRIYEQTSHDSRLQHLVI